MSKLQLPVYDPSKNIRIFLNDLETCKRENESRNESTNCKNDCKVYLINKHYYETSSISGLGYNVFMQINSYNNIFKEFIIFIYGSCSTGYYSQDIHASNLNIEKITCHVLEGLEFYTGQRKIFHNYGPCIRLEDYEMLCAKFNKTFVNDLIFDKPANPLYVDEIQIKVKVDKILNDRLITNLEKSKRFEVKNESVKSNSDEESYNPYEFDSDDEFLLSL